MTAGYHLDIVQARPPRESRDRALTARAIADLGLSTLVVTEADILREPRFTNAVEVWRYVAFSAPVCTENLIRVDDVMESPRLEE
jgi:hypothetical protein